MKKRGWRRVYIAITLLFAGVAVASSQTAGGSPFRIVNLDPALDEIISPTAKLEKLGEHFGLTEALVWWPEGGGSLLFSDNAANVSRSRGSCRRTWGSAMRTGRLCTSRHALICFEFD